MLHNVAVARRHAVLGDEHHGDLVALDVAAVGARQARAGAAPADATIDLFAGITYGLLEDAGGLMPAALLARMVGPRR